MRANVYFLSLCDGVTQMFVEEVFVLDGWFLDGFRGPQPQDSCVTCFNALARNNGKVSSTCRYFLQCVTAFLLDRPCF